MKSEERQNQMEELLLKSLNGIKTSEKDTTFSQDTIYSTRETLGYVPENDKTLWYILQTIWRRIQRGLQRMAKRRKKGTFITQENVYNWTQ